MDGPRKKNFFERKRFLDYGGGQNDDVEDIPFIEESDEPVSYTHLTLPTIYSVEI